MKECSLFSVPSPEFIICRAFNDGHLNLTVVLIYIFLIISNAEHLIMYLLDVCMSSLEKCLFRYSFIFVGGCFILFDTELCELSVLEIKPWLVALFAKFPPFHRLSFHFVYGFLFLQKLLSLKYLHIFSSSFMVSYLIFNSFSHFDFIFCMVWGSVLTSLICIQLSKFHNTNYWRYCLFSVVYSWLLCRRLVHWSCMGLFLGTLFCSIDSYICFCASTMLFWLV